MQYAIDVMENTVLAHRPLDAVVMRPELSQRPIRDVVDALAAAESVSGHLLVGIDRRAEMQIG